MFEHVYVKPASSLGSFDSTAGLPMLSMAMAACLGSFDSTAGLSMLSMAMSACLESFDSTAELPMLSMAMSALFKCYLFLITTYIDEQIFWKQNDIVRFQNYIPDYSVYKFGILECISLMFASVLNKWKLTLNKTKTSYDIQVGKCDVHKPYVNVSNLFVNGNIW